jgi:putative transposase
MSQSLSKLYLHLVFSTKDRMRWLSDTGRNHLHAYMAALITNMGCRIRLVNSTDDHVHILFEMARTLAVSKVVEDLKKSSSKWYKTQTDVSENFAWQNGYGVFSVSASNVESVRKYIMNQQEHHKKRSFQEEFLSILKKHAVAYDERFLWD